MKRKGNLYKDLLSDKAILSAVMKASKGKRNRPSVAKRLENIEETISEIKKILTSKSFTPSTMRTMTIHEYGKERLISKSPFFPDQIIHWLVMDAIRPLTERGMDFATCGTVPGRGTSGAIKILRKWIRNDPKGTKWCLKIDIHHYYQSIDRSKLILKLRRLIKDDDMIDLITRVVGGEGIGIPIGTYWSQGMANFYLQRIDHFIKENLGIGHTVRYVDDIVMLSSNRRKLMKAQKSLAYELAKEGVEMKSNWCVFQTSKRDIDFVGFRLHGNGRLSIRKRVWRMARRTILRIKHHGIGLKRARRLISYNGWIRSTNSHIIKERYLPLVSWNKATSLVSQSSRTEAKAKSQRRVNNYA